MFYIYINITAGRAGRPWFDFRQGQEFVFSITSRQALGPTHRPIRGHRGAVSPELKRQRHEVEHLPSSNAEVKNGVAISSLFYTSLWHCA
jgi:hypothetical protein